MDFEELIASIALARARILRARHQGDLEELQRLLIELEELEWLKQKMEEGYAD